MKIFFFLSAEFIFVFVVVVFGLLSSTQAVHLDGPTKDPLKILGDQIFGSWSKGGVYEIGLAPGPADGREGTLLLAANRTKRPDILRGFRRYRGGWDITNRHYWASVGFTGAAPFSLAILWLISFGLVLIIHHCCGWRISIKGNGSHRSQKICLTMLIAFTIAAATGSIVLSVGQKQFHGEALSTLKYVVNQSDYTVQTLKNVTQYLSLAKTISVAQVFLPSDVKIEIDKLNIDLNNAANKLAETTNENSDKIKGVFNIVRSSLITVAAVMLILCMLGLLLSIRGHQHAIHIFVVSGWLLVAVTFILCGGFVILNNAISDTCMAMQEWVNHPHAETALSRILPCVDQRTTNRTLMKSKEVVNDMVYVANNFIYSIANTNPSLGQSNYYNQSGPPMPPLCYPFDTNLNDRQCGPQEVSMGNASTVWQNYKCMVSGSGSGFCSTPGRVTSDIYSQLVAAINESIALQLYAPPLLSLQDCNFVRDTFEYIATNYCRPLEHSLQIVNAGLGLISAGVLLCLVLWIVCANRPQREEVSAKLSLPIEHLNKTNSCSNHREYDASFSDANVIQISQ